MNSSVNVFIYPFTKGNFFMSGSLFTAIEQRGIFIVPHLRGHEGPGFAVLSKGQPHIAAFDDKQGILRTYSYPDP